MRLAVAILPCFLACSSTSTPQNPDTPAQPDAPGGGDGAADAPPASGLGTVGGVTTIPCQAGTPAGSTCQQVTVSGCPSIETESVDATIAFLPATGTLKGTIIHFKGGGGEGFEVGGMANFKAAGYQQVFVSWATDWEQTASNGTKAGACRPSTIVKWVFDEPTLHDGSRTTAFCGQGFSGGSGQLGYALAHYGMGDYLDYVNELSGPPFARIDLGCNASEPSTAMVCGVADTMQLPPDRLNPWENTTTCGTANPPAADVAKWKADSISVGGTYAYPKTRVEFFDCTNNATAVTAMAQIFYGQLMAAGTQTAYHCYSQADGCNMESLGPTGAQAATDAMLAGCVARH
jgi:hypothetical protein